MLEQFRRCSPIGRGPVLNIGQRRFDPYQRHHLIDGSNHEPEAPNDERRTRSTLRILRPETRIFAEQVVSCCNARPRYAKVCGRSPARMVLPNLQYAKGKHGPRGVVEVYARSPGVVAASPIQRGDEIRPRKNYPTVRAARKSCLGLGLAGASANWISHGTSISDHAGSNPAALAIFPTQAG